MTKQVNHLKKRILYFHDQVTPPLKTLATLLDKACISHYSSGRGAKQITYDIFPASYYVHSLIKLVTLDRTHQPKCASGYKDFSKNSPYNPAEQFLRYLARWVGFAEELMQYEGDSKRGIAAAQAKLLMNELQENLTAPNTEKKKGKLSSKLLPAQASIDFFVLLENIGRALEHGHTQPGSPITAKKRLEQNYKKALAAAAEKLKQQPLAA